MTQRPRRESIGSAQYEPAAAAAAIIPPAKKNKLVAAPNEVGGRRFPSSGRRAEHQQQKPRQKGEGVLHCTLLGEPLRSPQCSL